MRHERNDSLLVRSSLVMDTFGLCRCVAQVSKVHKIYFKDMVQRDVKDPMKLRLVFRYPEGCFDCDSAVWTCFIFAQEGGYCCCVTSCSLAWCLVAPPDRTDQKIVIGPWV